MPKMSLAQRSTTAARIQGRMKLARLLEMPEEELRDLARGLENSPLFKRLVGARIVTMEEYPSARLAARRFAGYGLRLSGGGLPELMDGNCDLARLMQGIGEETFEEWFLGDKPLSDEERARGCGISVQEARMLRELMDRASIQGEFQAPVAAPDRVYSAVAGIEIEDGKPVLAFFHREVWKNRYRVHQERLAPFMASISPAEAGRVNSLLRRLELVEQRKTTLYRLLEEALRAQAEYLLTGDPGLRRPFTQRAAAASLGADPRTVNRIISNKSVRMPWGAEVPMLVFFPSAKQINRERLWRLASENPGRRDEDLRRELERRHGVRLSRQSITQYRKELSLGCRGQASAGGPASGSSRIGARNAHMVQGQGIHGVRNDIDDDPRGPRSEG